MHTEVSQIYTRLSNPILVTLGNSSLSGPAPGIQREERPRRHWSRRKSCS